MRSCSVRDASEQPTQLRARAQDSTISTRRSTAWLQARLICANWPLSVFSDALNGVYDADWLVTTRSMRTEPITACVTAATLTNRIDAGAHVSGPCPPRLLYSRYASLNSKLTRLNSASSASKPEPLASLAMRCVTTLARASTLSSSSPSATISLSRLTSTRLIASRPLTPE